MIQPPRPQDAIPPKADPDDYRGRFREIVSDPLNLLIRRVPQAGVVRDGLVCLHNGNWVPIEGDGAYFGSFSDILEINRGVHEPLEEYVFQQLGDVLPTAPVMMELGSYWAHYSMWLKRIRPGSFPIMVEPLDLNMRAGMANFARHGFAGEFIQQFVGPGHLEIDAFLASRPGLRLDILHCDIDSHEIGMLSDAMISLEAKLIDRVFISTHSQDLHREVHATVGRAGYRIEVSADFDHQSTSCDGLVFASSPHVAPLFGSGFLSLGREEIAASSPQGLIQSLL